jgi:hypothetical protein
MAHYRLSVRALFSSSLLLLSLSFLLSTNRRHQRSLAPTTPASKSLYEDLYQGILPILPHLFGKCATIFCLGFEGNHPTRVRLLFFLKNGSCDGLYNYLV